MPTPPTPATPLVSVIVCVRNGERVLGRQLAALAAQETVHPYEVLIVDNGSTDGTRRVAQRWIDGGAGNARTARIVDAATKTGICHARNCGARDAAGTILAFCDADDAVEAGWVEQAAQSCTHTDVIATGKIVDASSGGILMASADGAPTPDGSPTAVTFAWGCSFAVRRGTFFRIGGFDESLPSYGQDDLDFGVRAHLAGVPVFYNDDMVVRYTVTTGHRKLRRRYRASIALACVWAHHPDVFGTFPSTLWFVRGILTGPVTLAARHRGPAKARLVAALLGTAHHVGLLVGALTWVRHGRLGATELVHD